jgi:hypothetical protein
MIIKIFSNTKRNKTNVINIRVQMTVDIFDGKDLLHFVFHHLFGKFHMTIIASKSNPSFLLNLIANKISSGGFFSRTTFLLHFHKVSKMVMV